MNRNFMYNGIEMPGVQSRFRIASFFFEQRTMNNEKQKNQMETKVKQKSNGNWNNNKIN
jgi:hypothetical protein